MMATRTWRSRWAREKRAVGGGQWGREDMQVAKPTSMAPGEEIFKPSGKAYLAGIRSTTIGR